MKSKSLSLSFFGGSGGGGGVQVTLENLFLSIQSLPLSNSVSLLVSMVTKDGKRNGNSVELRNMK